jgi:hypothetical protein
MIASITFLALLLIYSTAAFAHDDPVKNGWLKENGERLLHDDDPPMLLDSGGPDGGGYFFIDSDDNAMNAPTYRWIDISDSLNRIWLQQDDQLLGPFNIGFPFLYYGQAYTQIYVCSNGWISFSQETPDFLNRSMPTADEPDNIIAAFWDDLVPGTASRAYRRSNNADSCIIAWHHFDHYTGEGDYTFEIILTADGRIVCQYQDVLGVLNSHTIGIENRTGSAGLTYVYNSFRNESGTAIYFGTRPPRYNIHDVLPTTFLSPVSHQGAIGDSIRPVIRLHNAGFYTETFDARVVINHGGRVYDQTRRVSNFRPDSATFAVFPMFHIAEPGSYTLIAITELGTDQRRSNDTIALAYFVYPGIYTTDFEADSGSFFGTNDWQWGSPEHGGPEGAHSGEKVWGTILDGNHSPGPLLSSLFSDTLLLDSAVILTFWHWYETEAMFDGGNVKLSTDDGSNWTILTPQDGYDGILSDVFFNPLGGEPAFYGLSGDWIMETLDLSAYAGQAVLIKFDFGADNSFEASGWYIDDFTVMGAAEFTPGWAAGTVRDLATLQPIADAVVGTVHRADTCDLDGRYLLELLPGISRISAVAPYHNQVSIDTILVVPADTITLDFDLPAPVVQIDPSPLDTFVVQGRQAIFRRQLSNIGNGPLEFELHVENIPQSLMLGGPDQVFTSLNFGDEIFTFDPQIPTGDQTCVGVEFDGRHFWITGRHQIDDIHKLYKFDRNGALIQSYDQNTVSRWGWRDLAWDGRYIYASDENELAVIDPSSGRKIDTLPMPTAIAPPVRALTYDPATDHFWGANFTSDIIEFTRQALVVSSFPNDRHAYGLAWDDASPDGPWLWIFSQDGDPLAQISQFDPRTGTYTGIGFQAIDHNGGLPDLAGGLCFTTEWDSTKAAVFGMVIGRTAQSDSSDIVQGYEIAPYSRWLSISPISGVVQPDGSVDLAFTVDFSDSAFAPEQVHAARISVLNNSSYTPVISLTVGVRSGTDDGDPGLPSAFTLHRNYPNPFNSTTLISFDLPWASNARLDVFDIQGRLVANLFDKSLPAGRHRISWNAGRLPSGIYFYRLSSGDFTAAGRMILLR